MWEVHDPPSWTRWLSRAHLPPARGGASPKVDAGGASTPTPRRRHHASPRPLVVLPFPDTLPRRDVEHKKISGFIQETPSVRVLDQRLSEACARKQVPTCSRPQRGQSDDAP